MVAIVNEPRICLAGLRSELLAFKSLLDPLVPIRSVFPPEHPAAEVVCRRKLIVTFTRVNGFRGVGRLLLLAHAREIIFEIVHGQSGSSGHSGGPVGDVGSRSGWGLSGGQGSAKGLGSGDGRPDGSSNGNSSGRVANSSLLL